MRAHPARQGRLRHRGGRATVGPGAGRRGVPRPHRLRHRVAFRARGAAAERRDLARRTRSRQPDARDGSTMRIDWDARCWHGLSRATSSEGLSVQRRPPNYRCPKIALPTLTQVAPHAMAISKSADIPIDRTPSPCRAARSASHSKCGRGSCPAAARTSARPARRSESRLALVDEPIRIRARHA